MCRTGKNYLLKVNPTKLTNYKLAACQLEVGQIPFTVHLKSKDKFAIDNATSIRSHASESKSSLLKHNPATTHTQKPSLNKNK